MILAFVCTQTDCLQGLQVIQTQQGLGLSRVAVKDLMINGQALYWFAPLLT